MNKNKKKQKILQIKQTIEFNYQHLYQLNKYLKVEKYFFFFVFCIKLMLKSKKKFINNEIH